MPSGSVAWRCTDKRKPDKIKTCFFNLPGITVLGVIRKRIADVGIFLVAVCSPDV